ncbi:E3 ubiquitin-protein ligase [Vigna unguiculata]|uniref:E3 ubiquitin-protein ligase n=1 Tax=Vigna unguiculata TaxID=3917 RepID=A0A4D6LEA3_VIGUN|nr:E3 ubiquitin-protein ligase [Vigna unguiculata]
MDCVFDFVNMFKMLNPKVVLFYVQLSGGGQKWSFIIWLLFSYCGLLCIASLTAGKWLKRRQLHLLNSPEGMHISAFGIIMEMIQVPDWAFEAASTAQNATFHPGLYLTEAQKEAMEASIQELPTFKLDAVPTTCNECLICLEEFCAGNQVRGLPCGHNFHVECIDEWLRLNVSCPRCRCSAFPNLNLNAISDLHFDPEDFSNTSITRTHDLNQTTR